ncbi:MAG: division/cell wall cluster transcriptional repressor MraZ [bacterium]
MEPSDDETLGFIGKYEHQVDDKNRVILPSAIRDRIDPDQRLVISPGFDGCLALYPYEVFEEFVREAVEDGPSDNARQLRRKLVGEAREVSVDNQGRLVLPEQLKEKADINEQVTVVGNLSYVELWAPERHEEYLESADMEDSAEVLFEPGAS